MIAHRFLSVRTPRLILAATLPLAVAVLALVAAHAQPVRSASPHMAPASAMVAPAAVGAKDGADVTDAAPNPIDGRVGAFVPVADACSYYPITTCGGAVVNVSESFVGQLTHYVGLDVHLELTTAVCGSSIAGRPLEGPVVVRVQIADPCGPPLTPQACPKLAGRVPAAVIQAALAEPSRVRGWGERCNPAVPLGPLNPRMTRLTLLNPGVPFHPTLNGVVFKCGCP